MTCSLFILYYVVWFYIDNLLKFEIKTLNKVQKGLQIFYILIKFVDMFYNLRVWVVHQWWRRCFLNSTK